MPIIETEVWKKNPDRPGTVIFDSQRAAQDIFNELKAHLKTDGRLPDEYFLFDDRTWRDGALFPRDADIISSVNYGGNEGIYLDITLRYQKEVPEYNKATDTVEKKTHTVTEHFATGKTLGDTIDDLDRMNLVAASVTAAFYGSKREVLERYAQIENAKIEQANPPSVEEPDTVKTIYGNVRPGDWVISAGGNDYEYLIGTVTAIDKLGTPEHGTENETDDIHIDFTAFNYPPERIKEIEERFSVLYYEEYSYDAIPLDDVIMAPKMLISISNLSRDEITRMGNLRLNCEAFCNCFPGAVVPQSGRHGELLERLEQNLMDYQDSLMGFGKRELIEMAGKINAMSDAYSFMCYHGFSDEELNYYLQFQNPLEVVADAWNDRNTDLDEIGDVLYGLFDKQDALVDYPLVWDCEAPADPDARRFMDVDVIDFLGKIAEKVIIHNPGSFNDDIDALYKAAGSDNTDDKRLLWNVCSFGTHMNTEREAFIRDTSAYNTAVHYRETDPDMFGYVIEVTGRVGQRINGNIFDIGNYYAHAMHVKETSLVLDSVSLTYSDAWGVNAGKTITVPRYEYNDDRRRLMVESGDVTAVQFYPSESVRTMDDVLKQERSRYMSLPIGSVEAHLQKLTDTLAKTRDPIEAEQTAASLTHGFNGEIRPGDWVVVMPGEAFGGLVGQASEIIPLDSPKHTGSPTDEVLVNYAVTNYSHGREKEITLSWLYDETREINTGAVIVEANGLINITDLAPDTLRVIAESGDAARAFCEQTVHNLKNEKSAQPEKAGRAAAKPKSLADKLQAGKAKAEAYKAQNPQPITTKNNKKEID